MGESIINYSYPNELSFIIIDLTNILDPFARDGVCVGYAIYGAAVAIAPLQEDGTVASEMTHEPGVTGEILVSAPHVKDRYDTLWVTEEQSISTPGWHHTGDVGHLDAAGRL